MRRRRRRRRRKAESVCGDDEGLGFR